MKNNNFIQGTNFIIIFKNEFILLLMMYLKSPLMKIGCLNVYLYQKLLLFYIFETNNIFESVQSNLNTYLYQFGKILDSKISMNLYTKFTSIYPPNNANNTCAIGHK